MKKVILEDENSTSVLKQHLKSTEDATHKVDTYWLVILSVVETHGTGVTLGLLVSEKLLANESVAKPQPQFSL